MRGGGESNEPGDCVTGEGFGVATATNVYKQQLEGTDHHVISAACRRGRTALRKEKWRGCGGWR